RLLYPVLTELVDHPDRTQPRLPETGRRRVPAGLYTNEDHSRPAAGGRGRALVWEGRPMARIRPLEYAEVDAPMRAEYDHQVAAHGRVTNLKRTLAHDPVAFRALMQWYALRDEVLPFLGERLTTLFAHAISSQTDCLICSTFFRRLLTEAGE